MKTRYLLAALMLLLASALVMAAGSQDSASTFPDETVTINVPFGVGGNLDLKNRIIAKYMEEDLGVSVIVENKPGAAGMVGSTEFVSGEASGYQLICLNDGALILAGIMSNASFLPKDFAPAIGIDTVYSVLLANPEKTGIKDYETMVAYGKGNRVVFSSQGPSTVQYLAQKTMFNELSIESESLQSKSQADGVAAVLGGHADLAIISESKAKSYVESGELVPVMTFGPEAMKNYAGIAVIPSVTEFGLDLSFESFNFLAFKAGVDEGEREIISASLARVFALPAFQEEMAKVSKNLQPLPGDEVAAKVEAARGKIEQMNNNLK